MNKGKLLSLLATLGYKGQESADEINKYLSDNSIELKDAEGNAIDVAEALKAKSIVVAGTDELDPEEVKEPARRNAAKAHVGAVNADDDDAPRMQSPKAYANMMERKSYNIRANRNETAFPDADSAEAFGAYARSQIAELAGIKRYANKSEDLSIVKTLTTTGIGTGEALVPGDFMPSLIVNQERYGVARRVIGVTPMSERAMRVPRLSADVHVSGVGEGSAMTATDTPTTNSVELTARKIGALIKVSTEFVNDSRIGVSSMIAESVGRSLGKAEDQIAFLGDGTSTYYGFYGICPMLKGLSGTIANIAGLKVASGNTFDEFTLENFTALVGLLPQYADDPSCCWIANRYVAYNVMAKLGLGGNATGASIGTGNTIADISSGWSKQFLGYNVEPVQVMPKADANSQIAALFGNFKMACKLGIVNNSLAFETNTGRYFDEDVIAIRVTERVAFEAHDLGNVSATASARIPGPVVGLISAAS